MSNTKTLTLSAEELAKLIRAAAVSCRVEMRKTENHVNNLGVTPALAMAVAIFKIHEETGR